MCFYLKVKGRARAQSPVCIRDRHPRPCKIHLKMKNAEPGAAWAHTHPQGLAGALLVTAQPGREIPPATLPAGARAVLHNHAARLGTANLLLPQKALNVRGKIPVSLQLYNSRGQTH